jgi:uncharacterized protein with HEPN domain
MPPDRRIELLLFDIIERADAIASSLERLGGDDLAEDDTVRSAVLWSLAMIGEASNRLPEPFRTAHPEVEWSRIIGFRNFVMHTYESIDASILDVTSRERVPELRNKVVGILGSEYPLAAQALDANNGVEG